MSKILVTYFSRTGNTKKVADAIFETLEGDRTIQSLDEVPSLEGYELIFIGFPVHSHSVPIRVEEFIKKLPAGKKVALFSTHGSLTGSRLSREALEHAVGHHGDGKSARRPSQRSENHHVWKQIGRRGKRPTRDGAGTDEVPQEGRKVERVRVVQAGRISMRRCTAPMDHLHHSHCQRKSSDGRGLGGHWGSPRSR